MASSLTFFNAYLQYKDDGTVIIGTDEIKMLLVTDDYTFDASHSCLADVLSSPSSEVVQVDSPDNGYTTGGEILSGVAVTHTDSPVQGKVDFSDLTWTNLNATFRSGIIYANQTRNGIVKPLIGCVLFNTAPADIVVAGINFVAQWSANGFHTTTI
jgi:hypothetical protein